MEFKRYDGFLNGAPQKEIDKELPVCPFCGQHPHWNLNVKNGFTESITCMCEKCKGKLNAQFTSILNIDNLRVVDVGERNINSLTLNETYHIITLSLLAKNSPPANKNTDFIKQESTSSFSNVATYENTKTQKNLGILLLFSSQSWR